MWNRNYSSSLLLFLAGFICLSISFTSVNAENRLICGQDNTVLAGEEGWKLVQGKDDINVYLRKTPISPIKVFKGVMELDIEFSRLVALIWDGEGYTNWLMLCSEAELLEVVSDTEAYLYTMNQPMWPVKKRDNICHRTIYQDPETLAVTVETCLAEDYIPEKKGRVRVPLLMGYGKVTPLENGKVELIYEVLCDVGGWIPAWIINYYAVNTPYTTFQNLKKMLPLDKYKDVRYSFITYPNNQGVEISAAGMLNKKTVK